MEKICVQGKWVSPEKYILLTNTRFPNFPHGVIIGIEEQERQMSEIRAETGGGKSVFHQESAVVQAAKESKVGIV